MKSIRDNEFLKRISSASSVSATVPIGIGIEGEGATHWFNLIFKKIMRNVSTYFKIPDLARF